MNSDKPERLVITIGGLHGTGKTTYSKILAKIFDLRHVSAGGIFRQLAKKKGLSLQELCNLAKKRRDIDEYVDAKVREEAAKGSVVIDGLIAAWVVNENNCVKIWLLASDNVRFKRIAERDGISFDEAKNLTLNREKIAKERYKKFYDIDLDDLTIYDIILNTDLMPIDLGTRIFANVIREYIKFKNLKPNIFIKNHYKDLVR